MSGRPQSLSLIPGWLTVHRRLLVSLGLTVVALMAGVAFGLGLATHPGAQASAPQHPVAFAGSAVVIAAYGFVFGLLVLRRPSNAIGWIFGLFALVAAISNVSWAYLAYTTETSPARLPGAEVATVVGAVTIPLWPFLLLTLIVLFPGGLPLTRAWGWLVILAGGLTVLTAAATVLSAGPLPVWVAASPLAAGGIVGQAFAGVARVLLLLLALLNLIAVWPLYLRYRASEHIGRLQLKWLVYAGCVFGTCGLAYLLVTPGAGGASSATNTVAWLVLCFGALVVPLAALVAILQYHL